MARDQLGRCLREGPAGVVLEMPFARDDVRQKRVERPIVVDQALVEIPRFPVEEDVADVEDDGARRPHARISPGGP